MQYVEMSLPVEGSEQAEILMAQLSDWSFDSFSEETGLLKAYIPAKAYAEEKDEITAFLQENGHAFSVETMPDTNWNAVWESHFEPIVVEDRCLIRAPFHPARPGIEYEVVIMPKMSFGTGHHATTCLMVGEMLDLPLSGCGLDMGSGTGVLAILAVQRGATHVDAIDIDSWAYENCRENIHSNGVEDRVTPYLGDAALLAGKHYDFVLANINRNILLRDMEGYVTALNPGGVLLVSGILEQDISSIAARAESLGLDQVGERRQNGWVAMRFVKP